MLAYLTDVRAILGSLMGGHCEPFTSVDPTHGDSGRAYLERRRVRAYAVISVVVLTASAILRVWGPSPYAPRVQIRWTAEISETERGELERRFLLVEPQHREDTTWGYELSDPSPSVVRTIIDHPAVADTHYIDRSRAEIASDAPRSTTLLDRPGLGGWARPLFDWLILFSVSSLVVSGVWLTSAGKAQRN